MEDWYTLGEPKYEFYNVLFNHLKDDVARRNYLKITRETYKASRLYPKVCTYKGDKFSDEFIELVYATLEEWKMNVRGAKLNKLSIIKKSLIKNKERLLSLKNYTLKDIDTNIGLQNTLRYLFKDLQLVDKNNTPLVTFSKAMHFYFNDLIVPIDRKYTAKFFKKSFPSKKEKQWDYFLKIESAYSLFSNQVDIEKYIDKERNWNIPKTLDNMIIGYIKSLDIKQLEKDKEYLSKIILTNNIDEQQSITKEKANHKNFVSKRKQEKTTYEEDLQKYLVENMSVIEHGLKLFINKYGRKGIEFPASGKFIDILALDKDENFVVIELKLSMGHEKVKGQVLRNIDWVKKHLANDHQKVKGIIICKEINEDLRLAYENILNVELFECTFGTE
jgi:RecB family endonuclease NucS